jgi:mannose/fructose/N-acetylgalactosamine-specific phosphotransferase system component IIB
VFWGGVIIMVGNFILSIPGGPALFYVGLATIVVGVGLLKPNISAGFVSVAAAREKLPEWDQGKPRIIILTRDVGTMARVAEDGALAGRDVNIGGIHYAPGRTEVLSYLYLDNAERAALSRLVAEGTRTTAQDLPGGRRFSVEKLLANGRSDE